MHKIIQHVEYLALMARVTNCTENDTAHWRNLLTPTVTSDSSADSSRMRRALIRHPMTYRSTRITFERARVDGGKSLSRVKKKNSENKKDE